MIKHPTFSYFLDSVIETVERENQRIRVVYNFNPVEKSTTDDPYSLYSVTSVSVNDNNNILHELREMLRLEPGMTIGGREFENVTIEMVILLMEDRLKTMLGMILSLTLFPIQKVRNIVSLLFQSLTR